MYYASALGSTVTMLSKSYSGNSCPPVSMCCRQWPASWKRVSTSCNGATYSSAVSFVAPCMPLQTAAHITLSSLHSGRACELV